jgi:hypothetical protein
MSIQRQSKKACKILLSLWLTFIATGGAAAEDNRSIAVRNQVAQPGQPVTTMRHWKIKKGGFPQFLKASQEGVWPYFEKIGARVVGMWKVLNVIPDDKAGGMQNSGYQVLADNGKDYDEVYLVTRYASLDHWQATRSAIAMGGNGPDFEALLKALSIRSQLTIETDLTFLEGFNGPNPPYYLPGTGEQFSRDSR